MAMVLNSRQLMMIEEQTMAFSCMQSKSEKLDFVSFIIHHHLLFRDVLFRPTVEKVERPKFAVVCKVSK